MMEGFQQQPRPAPMACLEAQLVNEEEETDQEELRQRLKEEVRQELLVESQHQQQLPMVETVTAVPDQSHPLDASRPLLGGGLAGAIVMVLVTFATFISFIVEFVSLLFFALANLIYMLLPDYDESTIRNRSIAGKISYYLIEGPYYYLTVFPCLFFDAIARSIGILIYEILAGTVWFWASIHYCSVVAVTGGSSDNNIGRQSYQYLRMIVVWQGWTIRTIHQNWRLNRDLLEEIELWQEKDMEELKVAFDLSTPLWRF